ncbi:MAG: hypothetical protein HY000_15050 [Planctomycetes bacterium]|nr:hypothetical protein [Planctomycetota bacterium]
MTLSHCRFVWLAAAALVLSAGCGDDDGPIIAKAEGIVLVDGKPTKDIAVRFHPTNGPISVALTDENGKFVLTTRSLHDGAVVGNHEVALVHADPNRPIGQSEAEAIAKSPISIKYGRPETSGVKAKVEPDIVNSFVFELPGKGQQTK